MRVKSSLCCRYTTTPNQGVATFAAMLALHDDLLQSLGTELNRRSRRIRTMCFRYTTKRAARPLCACGSRRPAHAELTANRRNKSPSAIGMVGLEPTVPWSQATWGAAPLHPACQSERLDLNQRSPGPQPGAIPGFATLCRHRMTRVGFEPNLASLKDWQPHQKSNGPNARTLSLSGNTRCFGGGLEGARILLSWSSARRYTISATSPCR